MTWAGARWRRVRWPMPAIGPARGRSAREAVIVAVRADDGATGLGEAAPLEGMSRDTVEACERALAQAAEALPGVVTGRDEACAIAAALAATPAARFAVETALLATIAQRARCGVARLWGAEAGRELRCAVVVDDEGDARAARARCLKIKVGGEEAAAEDRARVARIARAVPAARLRLDANRRWPRGEVAERMAELREAANGEIEYVEEPCARAHELLGEELPLKVALDESVGELEAGELVRAMRSGRLAAVVLKPTLLGGFARCVEVAEAARRYGVAAVVSHALEGPIGTAACHEVARVIAEDVEVGLAPHPGLARWSEAA